MNMAYRRPKSIRDMYEEHFSPMDTREVSLHRVVNIVTRNSMPQQGVDYDRRFAEDDWYSDSQDYPDKRGRYEESSYQPNDHRYYEDDIQDNFHKNHLYQNNDGLYPPQYYGSDDLRHQLGSRNSGKGSRYHSRGRGPSQKSTANRKARDDRDYRISQPLIITRDRSPVRREAQPQTGRSGSNNSNRAVSSDKDKGHIQQQPHPKHKPTVVMNQTPSSSVEGSPQSSESSKEKTSAFVAESEEVATASMEPKLTPEEDVKARRFEAIKSKAQEIEKNYRHDCETFCTVVKMLVAKEPSLERLIQAPLDEILGEIKHRCLDSLKSFVNELDNVIKQPDTSA